MRSAPARAASIAAASAVPPAPCAWRPTGRPLALPTPSTSSRTRPGEREPDGSWTSTRAAPSSDRRAARSSSTSPASSGPGLCTSPIASSLPDARMASAASFRFSRSFSGSWRRKTSMPFPAALSMKRRTRSRSSGREPTRKLPRSAIWSGVSQIARSERMRSQGLSTPRRTAESKQPPPDTSSVANPALSSTSATSRIREAGTRAASGSCDRRRIVVSTRAAIRPARCSAALGCRP